MQLTSQSPTIIACTAMAVLGLASANAAAQTVAELPFAPGEQLTYSVRVGKLGNVGRGTMTVDGPITVRDVEVYGLHFNLRARVGFLTAVDRTCSWIDPHRMATLRFQKHERHPLSKYDEKVELFPQEQRWERAAGDSGISPTDDPLDELSFIYYVRTLPLVADTTYELNRHFETGRNPVHVKVVRRDTLVTEAGAFPTVFVELRVKDPRRYKGEGVIGIHFSDDRYHLPVRIASAMPLFGSTILTLVAHSYTSEHAAPEVH